VTANNRGRRQNYLDATTKRKVGRGGVDAATSL